MPWDEIERVYNKCLHNKHCGGGNKPARMIVGALIIKHKMNLSDEEAGKKRLEENSDREGSVRDNHPLDNTEKKKENEKEKEDDSFIDEEGKYHSGSLKMDATCCDVEVKYSTDLDVLNDVRDVSENA